MSLVADYESSSPESDNGSNKGNVETVVGTAEETPKNTEVGKEQHKDFNGTPEDTENVNIRKKSPVKLPSAKSVMKRRLSSENSVLANEYKKDEDNKTKALEQHVKMVSNPKSVPINGKVNGKKVCWMYRRGRCRLGKKCKMYHDNELRAAEATQKLTTENKLTQPPPYTPSPQKRPYDATVNDDDDNQDGQKNKIHKKRFGLGDDIVPSKKVIQHFDRINQEAQPGH